MKRIALTLVLGLSMALCACNFDGGVEQGRCVAFDPDTRKVTLVVDTALDQFNPHYSGKGDTFQLSDDPRDVGPMPVAGGLLMLETDKNMVLYYDQATNSLKELPVEYTDIVKGVTARDARLKGKTFPIIDKDKHTITVYSPRMEALVTFRVSDAELAMPVYTWTLGDEVRIAYRNSERTKAIRMMNVTKTNIFTR